MEAIPIWEDASSVRGRWLVGERDTGIDSEEYLMLEPLG